MRKIDYLQQFGRKLRKAKVTLGEAQVVMSLVDGGISTEQVALRTGTGYLYAEASLGLLKTQSYIKAVGEGKNRVWSLGDKGETLVRYILKQEN